MTSIVQSVEKVLKSDLRLNNALKMGVVNYRKMANLIQKDVSKAAGHNVGVGTITVTLQRIASRDRKSQTTKYETILGESRLQLRDDITILYLRQDIEVDKRQEESDFFLIKIKGIGSTTILVDDAHAKVMEYKKENLLKKITNLSAIIITSPLGIVDTPGVIAYLMMSLGGNDINVVEVTSSYQNTYLIVGRRDSITAMEIIRSLISNSRK